MKVAKDLCCCPVVARTCTPIKGIPVLYTIQYTLIPLLRSASAEWYNSSVQCATEMNPTLLLVGIEW
eukprot:COSAG02_NODE_5552_length_4235_cov_26.249275_4_plen_67_part_00